MADKNLFYNIIPFFLNILTRLIHSPMLRNCFSSSLVSFPSLTYLLITYLNLFNLFLVRYPLEITKLHPNWYMIKKSNTSDLLLICKESDRIALQFLFFLIHNFLRIDLISWMEYNIIQAMKIMMRQYSN